MFPGVQGLGTVKLVREALAGAFPVSREVFESIPT
jgi:hypothetical protein